jgi:hypothetical protein
LAVGLSGLPTTWSSGTDNSSTASSFSFSFSSSSSSSSDPTSRERGVGIVGVATAGGDAALLFLFFFYSAAFTAEIAVATAEADFFATVDMVLRRDFAAPTTGSLQPPRQCLRRPPPTSQTHNSLADDLLEACTCLTSASSVVSPPLGEAPGTTSGARASTKQMT